MPRFRISSFSGGSGCVEVGRTADDGDVEIRHSRRPDGASLIFSEREWTAFVEGIKAGEFDSV